MSEHQPKPESYHFSGQNFVFNNFPKHYQAQELQETSREIRFILANA